ncbi:unnamed protein product [Leuciscus chuanchicus]
MSASKLPLLRLALVFPIEFLLPVSEVFPATQVSLGLFREDRSVLRTHQCEERVFRLFSAEKLHSPGNMFLCSRGSCSSSARSEFEFSAHVSSHQILTCFPAFRSPGSAAGPAVSCVKTLSIEKIDGFVQKCVILNTHRDSAEVCYPEHTPRPGRSVLS